MSYYHWSTLLAAFLVLGGAFIEFEKARTINDTIQHGIISDAIVVKKPSYCGGRGGSWVDVILPDGKKLDLKISRELCQEIEVNQSIGVFYSKENNKVVCYGPRNSNRKPSGYIVEICMFMLGLVFLSLYIYGYIQYRKENKRFKKHW